MRKLISVLLLSGALLAISWFKIVTASTGLTACGTLNQANETYILNQDVSSSGTCFTLTGNNITLDLNGHTVSYAQSTSGNGVNLGLYGIYTGITIKNGTLTGGYFNNSSGIYLLDGARNNITIYSLNINAQGVGSHGIYLPNSKDINIHDNVIDLNSPKGVQCSHYGDMVRGIALNHPSGNIDVYNNRITGKANMGIAVADCNSPFTEPMSIHDNYVSNWSSVRDGYAISISGRNNTCSGGSKIFNNTIDQQNGRGIAIAGWDVGTDYGPGNVEIYNNNVKVKEGWDCEYNAAGRGVGLRVRFGAHDVYAHDNVISGVAGTGVTQGSDPTHDGAEAVGLYVGAHEPYGSNNRYMNNTISVSTNNASYQAVGVYLSDLDPINAQGLPQTLSGNTITSNNRPIRIGWTDGGASPATFTGDTIIKGASPVDFKSITVGYWRYGAKNVSFKNMVGQNGADVHDIAFSGSCDGGCATFDNVNIAWTVTTNVTDQFGNAVANAQVKIQDKNGNEVSSGSSDANGNFNADLAEKRYDGQVTAQATSITPYSVTVSKTGYTTSTTSVSPISAISLSIKITGANVSANPIPVCLENWSCTEWSICSNTLQTRTCTDRNACGTTKDKPVETFNCTSGPSTQNNLPPNTQITERPISNTPVRNVSLAWQGVDDQTLPEDILFSYKLDNNSWSSWSKTKSITLNDLRNGKHSFEIRAKDSAGSIEKNSVAASFIINKPPYIAVAQKQGGSQVRVFNRQGILVSSFRAFESKFTGGTTIAMGDLGSDGVDEIIIGSGPGRRPEVKIFRRDGTQINSFLAYALNMQKGINVAIGDIDKDGKAEIITSPMNGNAPEIRIYAYKNGKYQQKYKAFNAFSKTYKGGVSIATTDVDGDGQAEIITSPLSRSQPVLRIFKFRNNKFTSLKTSNTPFATSYKNGVSLNTAQTNSSSSQQIIVSQLSGPSAMIKTISYSNNLFKTQSIIAKSFGTSFKGGVSSAAADTNLNGTDEIIVAPASNSDAIIKIYSTNGKTLLKTFRAFPASFKGGVRITAGE